jgi:hypothetical protein
MDPTISALTAANEVQWNALIPQLGFGGVIFVAFMFLLKWVLKTQDKVLDNSKEERATSQLVVQGFLKTLEQMNIQSSESHKQVTEAHNYQRAEHEKLMESLSEVCFTSKQNSDCLEKIKNNLDEQGKVLVRINGFKHD